MANSASLVTWFTQSFTFSPTYSSRHDLNSSAAPRCLRPSVSPNISIAASSFSGLLINQHFFALVNYTNAGPLSNSSSHHFLTSFSEPLPVASSANQHCLAALETCKRVISDWRIMAYMLIARGFPCVVPMIKFLAVCNKESRSLSVGVNRISCCGWTKHSGIV